MGECELYRTDTWGAATNPWAGKLGKKARPGVETGTGMGVGLLAVARVKVRSHVLCRARTITVGEAGLRVESR
jgi:hypothetical protein